MYLSVGFRFILVACVPYKCSLHSFMYVLFIVSRQHFGYILVLMFRIFETDIKILKNYMTLWRIKRLYKASAILTDNKTDILISGFIRISGCSWASLVSLSHSYNRNGYRQRAPKRDRNLGISVLCSLLGISIIGVWFFHFFQGCRCRFDLRSKFFFDFGRNVNIRRKVCNFTEVWSI